jgi:enamine deaminase RidA (YjgF/YER057c/UK114 family)
MNQFEERIREIGITLPSLPAPGANYVPAKRVGNLIFTAGQVSVIDGHEYKGKLGGLYTSLMNRPI